MPMILKDAAEVSKEIADRLSTSLNTLPMEAPTWKEYQQSHYVLKVENIGGHYHIQFFLIPRTNPPVETPQSLLPESVSYFHRELIYNCLWRLNQHEKYLPSQEGEVLTHQYLIAYEAPVINPARQFCHKSDLEYVVLKINDHLFTAPDEVFNG